MCTLRYNSLHYILHQYILLEYTAHVSYNIQPMDDYNIATKMHFINSQEHLSIYIQATAGFIIVTCNIVIYFSNVCYPGISESRWRQQAIRTELVSTTA